MNVSPFDSDLDADLFSAIERKGYESLTTIQQAVLDLDASTKDLRITSITGSGKTLAIGFAIRHIGNDDQKQRRGPRALVIVPTRELAKQVQSELAWLFEQRKWRIESVTGGTSIRDERRALSALPMVLVATPGRLLDHLRNGALCVDGVAAVVLDEADRMLDMGFQEDLQSILDELPSERRTHMASATFCDAVGRLANRYQRNPVHVQGTPLGQANQDIEHIVHVVSADQRVDAVVNLLLETPAEQAIVFARTRLDVASITRELAHSGFAAVSLSGEMAQPARDRALATFRRGSTRVLVATDVAARGLDIQGVTQVIHFDPPTDPDGYVHRSGRTGRAGQKGTSHLLVVPAGLGFVKMILRRAGTKFQVLPVPTANQLLAMRDERMLAELADASEASVVPSDRHRALAERLCAAGEAVEMVARLLTRVDTVGIAPREVRAMRVDDGVHSAAQRSPKVAKSKGRYAPDGLRQRFPESNRKQPQPGFERFPESNRKQPQPSFGRDTAGSSAEPGYGAFHVTWGETQGADARRLLAIVCRKGRIRSQDVGAIRIGATSSVVEVRAQVAAAFAKAAKGPDRRDPLVRIAPLRIQA